MAKDSVKDFVENVDVPPGGAPVPVYVFPEGDVTAKGQTAQALHAASRASVKLLIGQLEQKKLELERTIEDLENSLK